MREINPQGFPRRAGQHSAIHLEQYTVGTNEQSAMSSEPSAFERSGKGN